MSQKVVPLFSGKLEKSISTFDRFKPHEKVTFIMSEDIISAMNFIRMYQGSKKEDLVQEHIIVSLRHWR